VDRPQQHVMGSRGEADQDRIDAVLVDHAVQVPARPEHQWIMLIAREGVEVQEADRLQTQPGTLGKPTGRPTADLARADDQHPPRPVALEPAQGIQPGEQGPHPTQAGHRRQPQDDDVRTGEAAARRGRERCRRHGRDRADGRSATEIVAERRGENPVLTRDRQEAETDNDRGGHPGLRDAARDDGHTGDRERHDVEAGLQGSPSAAPAGT